MKDFKAFHSAKATLAGIERHHLLKLLNRYRIYRFERLIIVAIFFKINKKSYSIIDKYALSGTLNINNHF
jgi:hypothetical protein